MILKDVTKLLESAGLAVRALTKSTSSNPDDGHSQATSIREQKEDFKSATAKYFSILSSIDVRLRRQIYALEEAEIVHAELAPKDTQTTQHESPTSTDLGGSQNLLSNKQTGSTKHASKGVGPGNMDVGWLNSRNNKVGKEMEAELWAEAQAFVETLEERKAQDSEIDTIVPDLEN